MRRGRIYWRSREWNFDYVLVTRLGGRPRPDALTQTMIRRSRGLAFFGGRGLGSERRGLQHRGDKKPQAKCP